MEFGYPGSNTHIENHGVSEESFWPSFTDIMMVIVMIFLFVTVAVILNNWSLIADLKTSIKAQGIASNLADNRQEKNNSLQSALSILESQMVTLNEQYLAEKKELNKLINQKDSALTSLQSNLETEVNNLNALKKQHEVSVAKNQQLSQLNNQQKIAISNALATEKNLQTSLKNEKEKRVSLQTNYDQSIEKNTLLTQQNEEQQNSLKQTMIAKKTLEETLLNKNNTLATLQEDKENLQQDKEGKINEISALKDDIKSKTALLASLQSDRNNEQKTLATLQTAYNLAKEKISVGQEAVEQTSQKLLTLTKKQTDQVDKLNEAEIALKRSESEKQNIILVMNQKLIESEKKAKSLEGSLTDLTAKLESNKNEISKLEEAGNLQLRSLQGEYDSLDARYQKLLRPARSSKGKFVVSITYKKVGDTKVIRLKENPDGDYKTVNSDQLNKALAKLKTKHKEDLYLKIIIPNKSGLSYNEAWKFTSKLQRKYDYYHQ